jgi:hypothetical protein
MPSGRASSLSTATVREISVPPPKSRAVADHEAVRNLEADVADGTFDARYRIGLRQQTRRPPERRRLAGLEVAHQVGEGQAGVDDVFDDEARRRPFDVDVEVLQDAYDARRSPSRRRSSRSP